MRSVDGEVGQMARRAPRGEVRVFRGEVVAGEAWRSRPFQRAMVKDVVKGWSPVAPCSAADMVMPWW